MRKLLANKSGERKKFQARFSRIGKKVNFQGYSEDTILLTEVKDIEADNLVADHVWFTYNKTFQKASLREGMLIEFEARIVEYRKGYVNRSLNVDKSRRDYKLSHPTKVSIISPP